MGDNLRKLMQQGVEQNALTPSTVSSELVKSNAQNINESALQKTIQTLNNVPYSDTQVLNIKPEEYEKYDVTINRFDEDLDKQRAENQSVLEQGFNSIAQAIVSETLIGIPLGISDLFDVISGQVFKSNNDYTNPVSQTLEQWQEDFKNSTPIYRTNPNKSWDIGNSGWWFSNLPSVASSISLLVPAAGFTKGLSLIGKYTPAAKGFEKAMKAAKFKPSQISTAKHWIEAGTTAAASRTMENYREARGTYEQVNKQTLAELNSMSAEEHAKWIENNPEYNGKSNEEIANDVASKSADRTFLIDYSNIVFDVMQLHALKNVWKGLRNRPSTGVLSQTNKEAAQSLGKTAAEIAEQKAKRTFADKAVNKAKQYGLGSYYTIGAELSEGVEEAVNYVAQEEGINYGKELIGKVTNPFDERFQSYLSNGELWESAFWGVLGGVVFQGLGSQFGRLKNRVINKENRTEEEIRKAEILGRNAKWEKYKADIDRINKGEDIYNIDENGNFGSFENDAYQDLARKRREDEFIVDIAMSAANAGNIDYLKAYIQDANVNKIFSDLENENRKRNNQTPLSKEEETEYSQRIIDKIQEVEDLYDKNILLLDGKNVEPEYAQIIAAENTRKDISIKNLDREISYYDSEIARLMSEEGISKNIPENAQEYINAIVKRTRLQFLNKEKKKLEKDNTLSGIIGKRAIDKEIDAIKSSLIDDDLSTSVLYDSFITEVNNAKEKEEAQKWLDEKIEKEGPNVDKVAREAAITQQRIKLFGIYDDIAKVNQSLADNMVNKAAYEMERNTLANTKTVTENDIKIKRSEISNSIDEVRAKAVDDSTNNIIDLYKKYDTKEVLNYINNSSSNITNITDEDKKLLDDSLNILKLDAEENQILFDNLMRLGAIIDISKSINGGRVNGEKPINPIKEEQPIEEPTDLAQSTQPVQPTQPTQPAQPVQPVQPNKPKIDEALFATPDEDLLENVGSSFMQKLKNDKSIDLNVLKDEVIDDYIKQGFKKEDIEKRLTPVINGIIKRRQRAEANQNKNSAIVETFEDTAYDLLLNSAITENINSNDYQNAVENYINKYAENVGLKQTNGKTFINLENLMRYTQNNTSDKDLANIIFNSLKQYLINQSNTNGKYILTDETNVEKLNKQDFFNNVNKTTEERIKERTNEIVKQRVDIYNLTFNEADEYDKFEEALNEIQQGDNLTPVIAEGEIQLLYKGTKIGRLPIPYIEPTTGAYKMRNDGWIYSITRVNGKIQSPLKDLISEWLITRSDETAVEELNYIINQIAYNKGLSVEERIDLINRFQNNKEIINAKTNGFIDLNASSEELLNGLASIYGYVSQDLENEYKYISIEQWFEKLQNSYEGVTNLLNGNKQVKVAEISDGELIYTNEEISPRKAIVNFNPKVNKMMIATENNYLTVSGSTQKIPWNVRRGSTFVLIPNRNGRHQYAQATPLKLGNDNISKEAKEIREEIKKQIVEMYKKKSNGEITFNEFASFIKGLFSNGKGNTSLLGGVVTTYTDNGNYITISIPNTTIGLTFYNKTKSGANATKVGLLNNQGSKEINDSEVNNLINQIVDNSNFLISFSGIKSDANAAFPFGNNPVIFKENGKFTIKIGDKNWNYDSFSDFLLNNDLVTVHVGKTKDGKSNFRRIATKTGGNQILNVVIEDISSSPVERVDDNSITTKIQNILNNKRIKNKGSKIAESLIDKSTKDLFKRLGIIPENIKFVDEVLDNNGKPVILQVNVKTKEVKLTNEFLKLAESDSKQAFRKLIHEGIHLKIAENPNIVSEISDIFEEFRNVAIKLDENDPIRKYLLNQYSGNIQLEEFLVESLTSKELMNFLNNTESKIQDKAGNKLSLFQKILNALAKLVGIDINKDSLLEKEFIALGDKLALPSITNNETSTEQSIDDKIQQAINNKLNTPEIKKEINDNISKDEFGEESDFDDFTLDIETDEFNSSIREYDSAKTYPSLGSYLETISPYDQSKILDFIENGELNYVCR